MGQMKTRHAALYTKFANSMHADTLLIITLISMCISSPKTCIKPRRSDQETLPAHPQPTSNTLQINTMSQNSNNAKESRAQPAAKPETEKEQGQEPKPEMIASLRNIKDHPASWMTYGGVYDGRKDGL